MLTKGSSIVPFRVPKPAKAAFWCKTHRQKGPKNRFLPAIRHSFIKKLAQVSGTTPSDGDKNMAADTRLEYNTKARQSNEIDGLFLMPGQAPQPQHIGDAVGRGNTSPIG